MEAQQPKDTNENPKKYRFWRQPSFKKKGPEVKQTKTSLARLHKANPLTSILNKENEYSTNTKIVSGSHVNLEYKIVRTGRINSVDFQEAVTSTTAKTDKDFKKPKQKNKKVEKIQNDVNNKKPRTLSSIHFNKKRMEMQALVTENNNKIFHRRRSKSLEIKRDFGKQPLEEKIIRKTDKFTTAKIQKPTSKVTKEEIPLLKENDNVQDDDYDDENKENIEIADSSSYEELHIK